MQTAHAPRHIARCSAARALAGGACLALVLLTAAVAPAQGEPIAEGAKAPNFTLKDGAGTKYTLSAYAGKAMVVLDFGRFTCEPCRKTAKALEQLHRGYKGKGLRVFQVNLDGPLAGRVVPQGIKDLGITFPVLLDGDYAVAKRYGVETIPFVAVVDPEGVVRLTHTGYDEGLNARIVELLGEYGPGR
jgi:peroxiredoxin